MPIAFWREEYCTGNTLVDYQHQQLFKIINQFHDAMAAGHGKDVLMKTLNEVAMYTTRHFHDEEQMMVASGYPDYQRHKRIHDQLLKDVKALQENQNHSEDELLSVEVSKFLTKWLIHHIKGEDQKLIRFFREKGHN